MRDPKLRLCLLGIMMIATRLNPVHGLCSLVNGTDAVCHDLSDVRYMETYHLRSLKTSVSNENLSESDILSNLHHLRHLGLTQGQLRHVEPQTFRHLHDLRGLDLSHNKIEYLESGTFENLKKLQVVSLRKNKMTRIPDDLLRLEHLKILDIAGNPLNCDCKTVEMRDELLKRGVHLMKKIVCSEPPKTKGHQLVTLDSQTDCLFEKQDEEMQMDQPQALPLISSNSSSDEIPTERDDSTEETTENSLTIAVTPETIETPVPSESSQHEDSTVPTTKFTTELPSTIESTDRTLAERSTSTDPGILVPEDIDDHPGATPSSNVATTESTESHDDKSPSNQGIIATEGSGEEEDLYEGSGIEGSGTGVPPISWDVPHEQEETESDSSSSGNNGGLLETLGWGGIGGASASPEDDSTKDLDLQEEQFISASTEPAPTPKSPTNEDTIVPLVITRNEGVPDKNVDVINRKDSNPDINGVPDVTKSGRVQSNLENTVDMADASPARQPQKGMGSYVVLAILLFVLGTLIGLAAYKGQFCKNKRKRNDAERGTELRDMTKTLLDAGNGAQPKIASNGNLENVPLVFTSPNDDSETRYAAIPDVDQVKISAKSVTPTDDSTMALANGRSHQDLANSSSNSPEIRSRKDGPSEPTHNGKRLSDSLSSIDGDSRDSPIARTCPTESSPINGSIGNRRGIPPISLGPVAQIVKITLQDNPDSVPKTPILITRTKAGDNLVKTP